VPNRWYNHCRCVRNRNSYPFSWWTLVFYTTFLETILNTMLCNFFRSYYPSLDHFSYNFYGNKNNMIFQNNDTIVARSNVLFNSTLKPDASHVYRKHGFTLCHWLSYCLSWTDYNIYCMCLGCWGQVAVLLTLIRHV